MKKRILALLMSFVLCLSLVGTAFAAKPGDKVVIMVLDANGKLLDYPRVTLVAGEDGTAVLSPEDTKDIWEQGGRKYVLEEKEYDVIYTPPTDHEHKYEWKFDADGHWQVCANEDGKCDKPTTDKAAHTYDADGKCVCGATKPETPHTHSSSTGWQSNSSSHWQICDNTDGKCDATDHIFNQADHTFSGNTCTVCGYTKSSGGGGGGGGV